MPNHIKYAAMYVCTYVCYPSSTRIVYELHNKLSMHKKKLGVKIVLDKVSKSKRNCIN